MFGFHKRFCRETGQLQFARLRPVYVDDVAFENSFAAYSINPWGRKKLLKYILCRLEDSAQHANRAPMR